MERGSLDDLVKSWAEARETMTAAFCSMREVLQKLSAELDEMHKRLRPALDSINGTLQRLGIDLNEEQESPE